MLVHVWAKPKDIVQLSFNLTHSPIYMLNKRAAFDVKYHYRSQIELLPFTRTTLNPIRRFRITWQNPVESHIQLGFRCASFPPRHTARALASPPSPRTATIELDGPSLLPCTRSSRLLVASRIFCCRTARIASASPRYAHELGCQRQRLNRVSHVPYTRCTQTVTVQLNDRVALSEVLSKVSLSRSLSLLSLSALLPPFPHPSHSPTL